MLASGLAMQKLSGITAIVLAGGRSRRMGQDKAWLAYEGRPLVAYQAERLAEIFDDVRISAKDPAPFSAIPFGVIEDGEADFGPIYGLRASIRRSRNAVFALAVDLPRVPGELIRSLASALLAGDELVVAPRAQGKLQGLCAAYSDRALPSVESQIQKGDLSLYQLISHCGGEVWEEAMWRSLARPDVFSPANTPKEYETLHSR